MENEARSEAEKEARLEKEGRSLLSLLLLLFSSLTDGVM